jgi:diamine N-acetyltransferase
MLDITFRAAVASDDLCIAVLASQVFLDTYATEGVGPALANEVLEHFSCAALSGLLADPGVGFIVAERSGRLVGFAQVTHGAGQSLLPPGPSAKLDRLYVQRPFARQGIGKALLQLAESEAASRGAVTLWLTAWVENRRALAFYASQGYEDLGLDIYTYQGERYENRVLGKGVRIEGR